MEHSSTPLKATNTLFEEENSLDLKIFLNTQLKYNNLHLKDPLPLLTNRLQLNLCITSEHGLAKAISKIKVPTIQTVSVFYYHKKCRKYTKKLIKNALRSKVGTIEISELVPLARESQSTELTRWIWPKLYLWTSTVFFQNMNFPSKLFHKVFICSRLWKRLKIFGSTISLKKFCLPWHKFNIKLISLDWWGRKLVNNWEESSETLSRIVEGISAGTLKHSVKKITLSDWGLSGDRVKAIFLTHNLRGIQVWGSFTNIMEREAYEFKL